MNYKEAETTTRSTVTMGMLSYRVAPKRMSRNLCNYNGAYTSWGEISFGTFVDQYVLLLTYKFQ